jgi:hypothetical protein
MKSEIEKRLEKQRSILSGVHSQIADLQAKAEIAEAIIKELESLYRTFPRDGSRNDGSTSPTSEMTLRRGSDVWKAREALREFKQPTHIDQIMGKMDKEITKASKRSLASQLSWYARRNQIFTKSEAHIFGLLEWEAQKKESGNNEEAENVET